MDPALTNALPSHYYFDDEHHRREMLAIWHREWICVGRFDTLHEPGNYQTVEIDDQNIIIVRAEDGELRAFHNTCRHRGSILCEATQGQFANARIVCPYHAWTYSLDGRLTNTPWRLASKDFDAGQFSLYEVAVVEWAGYVLINLSMERSSGLHDALANIPRLFTNWDLAATKVVHRMTIELACNWKLFWENFMECYHCPGIHPELCRVVPTYGRGFSSHRENPNASAEELASARLAPGAVTWTTDGQSRLPAFKSLTETERAAGHTYGVSTPSFYLVGHIDYARMVHMLPLAPERTRLTIDWMLSDEALAAGEFDLDELIALGALVVEQDGRACELNQRGLRARPHKNGVLVTQEQGVAEFQSWVQNRLSNTTAG